MDEKLRIRKSLQDITNRIHAAKNITQILIDLKDGILNLFNAFSITLYVVDKNRNEIYSMFLAGSQLKEIRVPISNQSIAGYVANTFNIVNISDAYNQAELKAIDFELTFDSSWDKKSGFRTKQILAAPIFYEDQLMGVIQVLNRKKGSGKFTEDEVGLVMEVVEVLGVAFYNQQRLERRRKTRFDFLLTRGMVKEEEMDAAWDEAREAKESVERYLMRKYRISKDDIGHSFEEFYRCRFIDYSEKTIIPGDLIRNLKKDYLQRELWVPLEIRGGKVVVIVDDPQNIIKRDMIENILKTKSIEFLCATKQDIGKFIEYFYDVGEPGPDDIAPSGIDYDAKKDGANGLSEADVNVVKLLNDAINEAYDKRASDIHIEPDIKDKLVSIRFRIDGECIPYKNYPYEYRAAIVSRIKIMADLDITEKRLPQDGKIKYKVPGADEIELRVATLPTHGYVEDVVLRLLTRGKIMTLDELEMPPNVHHRFKAQLTKPYGLILLVGPTGSGKTTTAHAALQVINKPNVKIWTVEDPVEITQQGIRQLQVHHKIGLDFATAMRSFLRADPDVIMVGEMRDYETAKMGIEASTTGHLVMSTLHTNNAPETIIRLLDMGIDPFAFADSLLCVLAQRLVRRLCGKCKEAYHPSAQEYAELAHHYGEKDFAALNIACGDDFKLYRAKGCDQCNHMGYRGRMGLFELLMASDNIKHMIINRKSMAALRKTSMTEGMETLLQCGVSKVIAGETDLMEVLSVCIR